MRQESEEDGQFDDAPEDKQVPIDPRAGGTFIDDPLLQWSDTEDEIENEEDEEALREEDYNDNRVEDEDWETVERGTLLTIPQS